MSKRFTPIRGTEEAIRNLNIEDGHIYFASDTGHVYMDKDSETRIAISGRGSSIFLFDYTDPLTTFNGQYIFPVNKLTYAESNFYSDTIKDDDIIINLASGELFRVLYVDDKQSISSAICDKITLAGTSGDDGGSQTPGINTISLELLSSIPYRFVYGKEAYASFVSTAVGSSDINIKVTVIGADGSTHERRKMVQSGEEFEIEFGSLLFLGDNTILVSANGDNIVNSGTIEKRYRQRQATNLELKRPEGNSIYTYQTGDAISFSYIPIGAVEKQIELFIDGRSVYTETIPSNISGSTRSINITKEMVTNENGEETSLLSGYHQLVLRLSASDEDGNNTIEAKPLSYELAWVDDTTSAPIIWFPNGTPDSVSQYSVVNIEYMVFDIEKSKDMKVYLLKGEETTGTELSLNYTPGVPHIWTLNELVVGTNEFSIKCGNTERRFSIDCVALTERDLSVIKEGLILNLDASGRSNNEDVENRYSWPRGNRTNGIKFNDFNWYNNGWITDEKTGLTCLRISNGASISIPFTKLNSEQLEKHLALEFRFKIRNVKEYTTLTTRGAVSDDNGEKTVISLETENSVCGRFFGPQKGLLIGTQEAVFTYGPTLSVRYKEDEIINLSLVFDASQQLIYMYLNGVMSSALHYNNFSNLNTKATEITFNSKYCDLDLYSIRAYETDSVFSIENVIHNYIATLNGSERLNAYDTNQIISYNYSTKEPYIDYYKMIAYNNEHPDTPLMPYAVVKSKTADDLLPYRKGDEKGCIVDFVNPYLDYLWEHRYDVDTSKHPVVNAEKYMKSCPSFHYDSGKKANFNVQGTSSQGYPRRNFKLKTKGCSEWYYTNGPAAAKKDAEGHIITDDLLQIINGVTVDDIKYKKWYMDSNLPADKFCWKADYMESSGSYNTGFANFADILYTHHPLYDLLKNDDSLTAAEKEALNEYRTSVYGFPMLVFQEKQERAEDGKAQYEFVGKYNFNLDKSSNTRYGFELDLPHPYVSGKTIKKIAECWELTNNQGTYCAFRTPWPDENSSFAPIAADSFEYRYNSDEDGLDSIKFTGVLADDKDPTTAKGSKYPTARPYFANLKKLYDWLYEIGQIEDAETRKTEFKKDFDKHLNKEYCLVYFILTELLHCYDSRGKNMMLASWGPEEEDGEYIWYPIFYDIDTQLGLNNSGEQLWDYYAEPTDNDDFSTSNSVLWNCLWECYSADIKEKYNSLRTADKISYENVDGYYNFNPKYTKSLAMEGQRPLAIYNIDEYYKYLSPSLTGFIDTSGNIANDSWGHLYCLQGTRKLSRALYLRNRINYLDSKWLGGAYAYTAVNGGGFETRLNANYLGKTSDEYIVGTTDGYISETDEEWPNVLDANPTFTIRPFLKQYVSVYYDRTPTTPIQSDFSQKNIIFKKVEKEYFLTNDTELSENKKYYHFMNNEYVLIPDLTLDLFTAVPTNEVTNLNYGNYYLKDENDEYVPGNSMPYDHTLTYYYWNVWERSYKVTPDNFKDFYIKDIDGNFIQPNKYDESATYDDHTDYYELVELIAEKPVAASTGLVTVTPDADIIRAYKQTPNHTQQLAYVTGAEYISDLGDLSNKYFNQFNIGGAYRLENLILGSDAQIDGKPYKNEVLKNILLATSKNDLHPKTLLKRINLNGLTNFNSFLDITGCEKLEEFRALRTALPQVAFADGVQIRMLHLPNSINTLTLKKANKLTKVISSALNENNEPQDGLYIEGLTNTENAPESTNIIKISIEGDHLGYDSYKLLSRLVETKQFMKANHSTTDSDLAIGMRDINWSPYTVVPYGTEYDENETYYLDNGRFNLVQINSGSSIHDVVVTNWSHYLSNSLIFTKTDDAYGTSGYTYPINNLTLLNTFINDYDGKTRKADTQFSNDDPYEDQVSLPDITGILFVDNEVDIKETTLKAYSKYFPKLRIFCKNVEQGAKITYMYYKDIIPETVPEGNIIDNINNIIEYTELAQFSDVALDITKFPAPSANHYKFLGWKVFNTELRKPVGEFITGTDGVVKNNATIHINMGEEYSLIALFEVEVYNITFIYQRSADGTESLCEPLVVKYAYNEPIQFPDVTKYYPWKDDSALGFTKTYRLLGYDKNQDATTASFVANGPKPLAERETTYYATFKVDDVTRNVLDNSFLLEAEENGVVKMWIDPEKVLTLRGKITLPAVTPSKAKYTIFGSGVESESWTKPDAAGSFHALGEDIKITHIFWSGVNEKFTTINSFCFFKWFSLQAVMLPDSVTTIKERSFYDITGSMNGSFATGINNFTLGNGMSALDPTQEYLNYFFRNITSFGNYCLATEAVSWEPQSQFPFHTKTIIINGDIQFNGTYILDGVGLGRYNLPGRLQLGTPDHPLNNQFIDYLISHPVNFNNNNSGSLHVFSREDNAALYTIFNITIYSSYLYNMQTTNPEGVKTFLKHLIEPSPDISWRDVDIREA